MNCQQATNRTDPQNLLSTTLDVLLQGGLIADSSNFNRVHLDLVLQDDQSEVLNLLPMELTLLWVKK